MKVKINRLFVSWKRKTQKPPHENENKIKRVSLNLLNKNLWIIKEIERERESEKEKNLKKKDFSIQLFSCLANKF
jgi:hypothetical protein